MKKIIFKSILSIAFTLSLFACSADHSYENAATEMQEVLSTNQEGIYGNSNEHDFNQEMQAFSNRKLIRTGDIRFETKNIAKTEDQIKWMVRKLGGFIAFEQQTRNDWSVRTDLEIRMPSSIFEKVLDSISQGAYAIDEKNIKVKDVTEQYVDTEARIETRKMVEQKYLEHLVKANTIEDVLKVENKIGQIREEIESAEKRLRTLKDQVALSTLHVEFYQQIDRPQVNQPNRFELAIKNGWYGLETFLVFLTNIWPLIILGFVGFWGIKRYIKSKKQSN